MNRPNILYIHSHDTGRYVQPYGYPVSTPNIQKLAAQGTLFRQAFCASPGCSPSRAALLTGQSAHSSGMLGLAHRGWGLHDYGQHIIHTLAKVGYSSALCGVQHVAAGPNSVQTIGYDHHIEADSARARDVAPAAARWLDNAPDEPWFLAVGFVETHTMPASGQALFGCGPGNADNVRPPAPLPDVPQTRQDFADYQRAVTVLDEGIGAVLRALEENGLAENTLVICTTDHGLPLPSMKCNLTDGGLGVMLIMSGPGVWSEARTVDALISQIDIFPTLCEFLEIEKPTWLQGRSLLPILRGETAEINDAIFAEVTHHAAYEPMRAVRTKRWKYIRRFGGRATPVLPNCDDSRSKDFWVENGWRERRVDEESLFDLAFDPNETNNLAGDSSHAATLTEMRARLDEWMQRTDDPILRGPVPVPVGTIEKNPDDLSPSREGKE